MTARALPQTCGDHGRPVVWIRPGQVGYVGPDLGVGLHATSVGVLTVGLDAPLLLETPGQGTITARSVYAPARAPHRVVAPEGRILLLFTDAAAGPGDRTAAAMRRRLGPYGIDHVLEEELIAVCRRAVPDPEALRRFTAAGRSGTGSGIGSGAASTAPADRRIRRVLDEIRADPGPVLSAEQSARSLDLSTPHFLRLFAHHTGTTFRRYQQWNRLLEATRGIAAGHPLTRCAADAGFASPSHLSDTFRETLGTTASAVLDSGVWFDLGE